MRPFSKIRVKTGHFGALVRISANVALFQRERGRWG